MDKIKYTYAVARIRALEVSLFSDAFIEQLLACKSAEQVLQSVVEKGWGDMDTGHDAEAVLKREEEKAWEVIRDVAPDMSAFDVLSYPKLYHNLKAAVKEVCTGVKNPAMFYDDCPIPGEEMYQIIESREFSRLPGNMSRTAQEALDTLLHTGDGQLCDIIVDRAALEAIEEAGKKSGEPIIENYADTTVAIADIKIAVRSQKTGKSADFVRSAMAECASLSLDQLIRAALSGAADPEEDAAEDADAEDAAAEEDDAAADDAEEFSCFTSAEDADCAEEELLSSFSATPRYSSRHRPAAMIFCASSTPT